MSTLSPIFDLPAPELGDAADIEQAVVPLRDRVEALLPNERYRERTVYFPGTVLAGDKAQFFVPVHSGEAKKLVGALTHMDAGTSATVKCQRKPWGAAIADVPGLGAVAVTAADSEKLATAPLAIAHKDLIVVQVSATNGATELAVSLYFEVSRTA